jgi:hypothetical protein
VLALNLRLTSCFPVQSELGSPLRQTAEDAFPQRQYFWFDHSQLTAVPALVHQFIGVPGDALLEDNRYALTTGCVPHECGGRGFLWIDTEPSDKPLLIFAATGLISSDAAGSGTSLIHLRLFASQKLNWQELPPSFKTNLSRCWRERVVVPHSHPTIWRGSRSVSEVVRVRRDAITKVPQEPGKPEICPSNHSLRRARTGDTELARTAGIKEATNAVPASATRAIAITTGSYGFVP